MIIKATEFGKDVKPLPTVDLIGIEIFEAGTWTDSEGTTRTFSGKDLENIVKRFEEDKGEVRPYLKISHLDRSQYTDAQGDPEEDEASLGWATRVYIEGSKLVADFTMVPKRLAQLARSGAFPRVSSEIYQTAKGWALKAVALLGSKPPAVDSLKALAALYIQPVVEDGATVVFSKEIPNEARDDEPGKEESMTPEELAAFKKQMADLSAKVDEQTIALKAKDDKIAEMEKSSSEAMIETRTQGLKKSLETAVSEGRVAPVVAGHFEKLIPILAQSEIVVSFSKAEGEAPKDTAGVDILEGILNLLPKVAAFGKGKMESAVKADGSSEEIKFAQPSVEVDTRTRKHMADHPGGDYRASMEAVLAADPELREAYGNPGDIPAHGNTGLS